MTPPTPSGLDLRRAERALIEFVFLRAIKKKNGKGERAFDLNHDIEALAEHLKSHPGIKLIIIDPISAYLGRTNSHNNAEVRAVLAPLAKLAADHRVAIVAITHLNKSLTTDPLARIMGSTAFIAAVRSAFLVERDKHNAERRLFLPLKSNISASRSRPRFPH